MTRLLLLCSAALLCSCASAPVVDHPDLLAGRGYADDAGVIGDGGAEEDAYGAPRMHELLSRALAEANDALLQVGHVERFNPAVRYLFTHVRRPLFIEAHRLSGFKNRATDVDVVLDLMIHDIDIILNIVKSDISEMRVSGTPVLTQSPDIANARLEFENGCVANVTASRVSAKTERKMRIFQHDAYISVDFHNRVLNVYKKGDKEMLPGIPEIVSEESTYENNDALNLEIIAFLDSIQNGTPVIVSGEDGRRALDAAIQISALLKD